jgi:hypothetical protein
VCVLGNQVSKLLAKLQALKLIFNLCFKVGHFHIRLLAPRPLVAMIIGYLVMFLGTDGVPLGHQASLVVLAEN